MHPSFGTLRNLRLSEDARTRSLDAAPMRRDELVRHLVGVHEDPGLRHHAHVVKDGSSRLRKLLDEGYSMTDLGRELGITRQAVYDLLKRAER